jgi:N-acetyl-gamma-glutamyl-phosphate reductase
LAPGVTATQVGDTLRAAYARATFVRLTGDRLPEIKHVVHTNFCDIGWKVEESTGRLIVIAVLDNLLKGAAGQAVQQFNLLCGFPESEGLL